MLVTLLRIHYGGMLTYVLGDRLIIIAEAEDGGETTAGVVLVLLRVYGHLSPDSYQICVDYAITHNALN